MRWSSRRSCPERRGGPFYVEESFVCRDGSDCSLSSEGSAFDEITKLTTRDLAVATQKWKGKKVETVKPCVYVDVDDYRCGSAKGSRLHFRTISNEEGRQHLEKYCDTLTKTTTSQCTVRIQIVFVYADNRVLERQHRSVTLISAEGDKAEIFACGASD
jgi:hypothetical protein